MEEKEIREELERLCGATVNVADVDCIMISDYDLGVTFEEIATKKKYVYVCTVLCHLRVGIHLNNVRALFLNIL